MLKIDKEFKELIPQLSKEEFDQLEKNCISEGIREPIITWHFENEEQIVIDGHNRFEIAKKNNLAYKSVLMEFGFRDEVIDWMINNQLGRRNLSKETQSYLRGLQYSREKVKQGTNNQYVQSEKVQNEPLHSTAEKLAKQHNVNESTIKRDEQYAKAVDTIVQNTTPEVKQMILNDRKMTKEQTIAIAQKEPEKQKEILEMVQEKNFEVKKAIQEVNRQEIKISEPKKLDGLFDVIYADCPWRYDFVRNMERR